MFKRDYLNLRMRKLSLRIQIYKSHFIIFTRLPAPKTFVSPRCLNLVIFRLLFYTLQILSKRFGRLDNVSW